MDDAQLALQASVRIRSKCPPAATLVTELIESPDGAPEIVKAPA